MFSQAFVAGIGEISNFDLVRDLTEIVDFLQDVSCK